jgi:hypothetical protein
MKQPHVHNEPLREGDGPDRTVGCRHTNPDVCGKHSIEKVCAFVREDNMCLDPPVSWKKQYLRLASLSKEKKESDKPIKERTQGSAPTP